MEFVTFFINTCDARKYIVIDVFFSHQHITILQNPHFIAMGFPFLVCRSVQPWFMLISPDTRLSTGSIQLMMMKKIILILIWCRFHWWFPSPVFRNQHSQDSEFCENEIFCGYYWITSNYHTLSISRRKGKSGPDSDSWWEREQVRRFCV